jgi:hypothetical protein
MVVLFRRSLAVVVAAGWMGLCGGAKLASAKSGAPSVSQQAGQEIPRINREDLERPLPDIPALMHAVEVNQRASEKVEKDYMYRSLQTHEEADGHGGVKKTETMEYDIFWVNGVRVHRLTKKNGKELSADEQKKESEQIDKQVARARERRAKADEKGSETDSGGHEVVTVSRLLELGSFTNARRVQLNGRDTIAVDFMGDPKAKTRSRFEEVIRDMAGTAWVDEQDKVLVKAQGHFVNSFKVGAGMVANIQKGTQFEGEWRKINDEVWLPSVFDGQGAARVLVFFHFNGSLRAVSSDYRKFKATSTILPGMSTVEPEPK